MIGLLGIVLAGCQTNELAKTKPTPEKTVVKKAKAAPHGPRVSHSVQALVRRSAIKHKVPVRLALAVSYQESTNRCNVRGAAGEVGPLQIKPESARGLGYKGSTSQLAKNCTDQIEFGMRHLAAAFRRGGTCWKAAYLHNAGVYAKSYRIRGARNYANKVSGRAKCA
ncbi:MAG: lytic transglycosylase domain-containing protein [Rhizobiaceae bacterium]|nr:lytic transglycosylase domain-containing protein [Rhizobiaceae bacterium]